MDNEAAAHIEPAGACEGLYLRRAQALLAERAELFAARPARSRRLAGNAGAPRQADSPSRRASRQLSLPLPRDRARRRLRMVG